MLRNESRRGADAPAPVGGPAYPRPMYGGPLPEEYRASPACVNAGAPDQAGEHEDFTASWPAWTRLPVETIDYSLFAEDGSLLDGGPR